MKTTVPGYQRRKQYTDLPNAEAYNDGDDTADYLSSQDGGNVIGSGNGLHTWHIGKADAEDHRKRASQLHISESDKGEEL